MALRLLKRGNTKIGKSILNFSLPPGETCPNKSEFCSKSCYALRFYRQYPNVRTAYNTNYQESEQMSFVNEINSELSSYNKKGNATVRMHVSGDFYNAAYVDKWTDIATTNSSTMFYGYTRSYQDNTILESLEKLRALPNVVLFASTDSSMSGTVPAGWRVAHVGDKPNKSYVTCLEQAGKVASCEECRICFKPAMTGNVHFIQH